MKDQPSLDFYFTFLPKSLKLFSSWWRLTNRLSYRVEISNRLDQLALYVMASGVSLTGSSAIEHQLISKSAWKHAMRKAILHVIMFTPFKWLLNSKDIKLQTKAILVTLRLIMKRKTYDVKKSSSPLPALPIVFSCQFHF